MKNLLFITSFAVLMVGCSSTTRMAEYQMHSDSPSKSFSNQKWQDANRGIVGLGLIANILPTIVKSYKDSDIRNYGLDGYNDRGYNKERYNKRGFNSYGIHKETKTKYDKNGFDKAGFNKDLVHFSTNTLYDQNGFNKSGYDANGYDKDGFNKDGLHKDTNTLVNSRGFNKDGIFKKTNSIYDLEGYNVSGINRNGETREWPPLHKGTKCDMRFKSSLNSARLNLLNPYK